MSSEWATISAMAQKIPFRLPQESDLQAAVGRVAMAHASLEFLLRLTIKSITGEPFGESLFSTRRKMSKWLRDRVLRVAKEQQIGQVATEKLAEMGARIGELSDERNHVLHRQWLETCDGKIMVSGDDDKLRRLDVPAEIQRLDSLTGRLWNMTQEINQTRRKGWLKDAIEQAVRHRTLPP